METPLVSIIVPIYNIEKYLCECIDSILNQTYSHIEVILVDDGSTDSCPQICDDYQAKDKRVKVIHKANGGTSSAREDGVNESTGQYIMFVDGDDWLELNAVELCMEEIKKDSDIGCVIFSYSKETPNRTIKVKILESSGHFLGNDAKENIYRRFFGPMGNELKHPERMENIVTCWGKLYQRRFVLQGRYYDLKEISSCEDALFNIYALQNCENISYLNLQLYHYRKRRQSLTKTYHPNFTNQRNRLFEIMEQAITETSSSDICKEALYNRIAMNILSIGSNEFKTHSNTHRKRIKTIKAYLRQENYQKAISNVKLGNFTLPWMMLMLCCKLKCASAVYAVIFIIQKLRNLL